MFLAEMASFVAAMLFAVHPIHTEAVSMFFFDPKGNFYEQKKTHAR